jgi:glycosyltransferase involved in cell wall biosynthesis
MGPTLQNKSCRVSIVIPVRDRADLLKRCLDSLKKQDFPGEHFEIIVCDDGSRGELSGTVKNFLPGPPHLGLVKQGCRGPAAARNLGILTSVSPIVLFVDSDIVADKKLVRNLATALEENPHWTGAEARLLPVEGTEGPLWEAPAALTGGRFHTAAIAYRRDALLAAGGLDEAFSLPACEDVELAARVLAVGPIGFVPDAKAYHPRRRIGIRIHWRSRLHWKYHVILAERYGFLAFPERRIGRFHRLRVGYAAVASMPIGRLLNSLRWIQRRPFDAAIGSFYAIFDVVCGFWALPGIFFSSVPERADYLRNKIAPAAQRLEEMQPECRL